jgi:hypothetical protein
MMGPIVAVLMCPASVRIARHDCKSIAASWVVRAAASI